MNEQASCPECGKPLPDGSTHGLCPACLMGQAMASRTFDTREDNTQPPPPPSPEEIADKFPQFEMIECLGRGGMGVVYKARQKALDRLVAVKILAGERQGEAGFRERFEKEAKMLAQLSHSNIVTVHDFGETDGLYYIVMEYVDGVNLRDLLREGKMAPEQALAVVPPICEALEYAHEKCVVHRDIKPENLLLDRAGRVKIADFGIAALIGAAAERSGTPPYMAPEQEAAEGTVDHRADIYALGAVFYEMLTGERPEKDPSKPSRRVEIDVRLDEIVLRALEKEPEQRYQTAREFRTMVETVAAPGASAAIHTDASAAGPQPHGRWRGVDRRSKRTLFGLPLWLKRKEQRPPSEGAASGGEASSSESAMESHFSRSAIIGAVWIGLFFLNWLVSYTAPGWALTRFFRNSPFNLVSELLLFLPLMVLGFAAIVGGSVMGGVALQQIRQAHGAVRGFGLALLDLLFLPQLLLNAWVAWLSWQVMEQMGWVGNPWSGSSGIGALSISILVILVVGLNGLLVRTMARAAAQFVETPALPARPHRRGSLRQVIKGVFLRLVLVITVQLALFETLQQVSVHWRESTGELWGMALAVVSLGGVIWACRPAYRLKHSWLYWAGGTMASYILLLGLNNFYSWHLRPNLGLYRESDWVAQHPGFQKQLRERIGNNLWRTAPQGTTTSVNQNENSAAIRGEDMSGFSGRYQGQLGDWKVDWRIVEVAGVLYWLEHEREKVAEDNRLKEVDGMLLAEDGAEKFRFSLSKQGLLFEMWSKNDGRKMAEFELVRAGEFKPVVETTIASRSKGGLGSYLNLETGRQMTPPKMRLEASLNTELRTWARKSGLDGTIWLHKVDDIVADAAFQGIDVLATSAPDHAWKQMTPVELREQLDREIKSRNLGLPCITPMKARDGSNRTIVWLIKTREGSYGMLQIVDFTDTPPGVKLRYKLVQEARHPVPGTHRPAEGAQSDEAPKLPFDIFANLRSHENILRLRIERREQEQLVLWMDTGIKTLETKLRDLTKGTELEERTHLRIRQHAQLRGAVKQGDWKMAEEIYSKIADKGYVQDLRRILDAPQMSQETPR